jgi:hypothetical protein
MTKVYVLILRTWGCVEPFPEIDCVNSVHSSRASADAAAALLKTHEETVNVFIEEHDLIP